MMVTTMTSDGNLFDGSSTDLEIRHSLRRSTRRGTLRESATSAAAPALVVAAVAPLAGLKDEAFGVPYSTKSDMGDDDCNLDWAQNSWSPMMCTE